MNGKGGASGHACLAQHEKILNNIVNLLAKILKTISIDIANSVEKDAENERAGTRKKRKRILIIQYILILTQNGQGNPCLFDKIKEEEVNLFNRLYGDLQVINQLH